MRNPELRARPVVERRPLWLLRVRLGRDSLQKLTSEPADVGPADLKKLRKADVEEQAIVDAIEACTS